jgi:flavin-binding protein dodecin
MSIVKVIEVISEGATVDAAIKAAVEEASKTIKDIKQVNVEYIEGLVDNNKVTKIRINAKISFVVHH